MRYAPALVPRNLLERIGIRPSDFGIAKVNEAFASQAVVVKPDGGAILLGHSVGTTGATLLRKVG